MPKIKEYEGEAHIRTPRANINKLKDNKSISVEVPHLDRTRVRRGSTIYAASLSDEKLKCKVMFVRRRFFRTGFVVTVRAA